MGGKTLNTAAGLRLHTREARFLGPSGLVVPRGSADNLEPQLWL